MRIVADENIPYVREAFEGLGEIETMPGRAMDAAAVRDARVLLVRSVTKVTPELLEGSQVEFVATATIGEDHIDRDYLAKRGIGFASAPGSNANSVAEYIVSALLVLGQRGKLDLGQCRLGIVGVGNVGSRVHAKAQALGIECVLNDPPLARSTGDERYRPLGEALACDVITVHVPLTREGPDATHHLGDAAVLSQLPREAVLINTSRGAVVDNPALLEALEQGALRGAVLDVWEHEPHISALLLEAAELGTPHIAGYSFDGKVNGTRMIYEAACNHFGWTPSWTPAPLLPPPPCPEVAVDSRQPRLDALASAVHAVYDIRRDDEALRQLIPAAESERPGLFDRLRKEYPQRREFQNTRVHVAPPDDALSSVLRGLGFKDKEA
ncbi:MAG: 4-phosphoerythronate dehydrogenase PdxB [Candidatus Hydrogenedentota bacterium]